MNKAYSRINWQNEPSVNTPINEDNLNRMDMALNEIDNRVITHDTTKLNVAVANSLVKDVTFNEDTGVFTITKLNGSKVTLNTNLEKLAVNFTYDSATQRLIITLDDDTKQYVDLSALITQLEFLDSATISFTISSDGKVSASIKNGSINGEMLDPNYLAQIQVEVANAQKSASNAKKSEDNAKISETNAKTSETNAKLSEDNAKISETNALTSADRASTSETNALVSETNAKKSESNASISEKNAKASETASKTSETNAKSSEEEAKNSADLSKSYAVGTDNAVRENDSTDNSKYYSEVAKSLHEESATLLEEAKNTLEETNQKITKTKFSVNTETGELEYTSPNYNFNVTDDGMLHWEVA